MAKRKQAKKPKPREEIGDLFHVSRLAKNFKKAMEFKRRFIEFGILNVEREMLPYGCYIVRGITDITTFSGYLSDEARRESKR